MAIFTYKDARACARDFLAESKALEQRASTSRRGYEYSSIENSQPAIRPKVSVTFKCKGFYVAAQPSLDGRDGKAFGIFPVVDEDVDGFDLDAFKAQFGFGAVVWRSPVSGYLLVGVQFRHGIPYTRYEDKLEEGTGIPIFAADRTFMDYRYRTPHTVYGGLSGTHLLDNFDSRWVAREAATTPSTGDLRLIGDYDRLVYLGTERAGITPLRAAIRLHATVLLHPTMDGDRTVFLAQLLEDQRVAVAAPGPDYHWVTRETPDPLQNCVADYLSDPDTAPEHITYATAQKTVTHLRNLGRGNLLTALGLPSRTNEQRAPRTGRLISLREDEEITAPADLFTTPTVLTGDVPCGPLLTIGIDSDTLALRKFEPKSVLSLAAPTLPYASLSEHTRSPWLASEGRVFVHMARDAFRFFFALAMPYSRSVYGDYEKHRLRTAPAFLCFTHRVARRKTDTRRQMVSRALGRDLAALIYRTPGLCAALENAVNEARLYIQKAQAAGFHLQGSDLITEGREKALPPRQVVTFPGLGTREINTARAKDGFSPRPATTQYFANYAERDGYWSLLIGVGNSKHSRRRCQEATARLIDHVHACFSSLGANMLRVGVTVAAVVCNPVQRPVVIDDEDFQPAVASAPSTYRITRLLDI